MFTIPIRRALTLLVGALVLVSLLPSPAQAACGSGRQELVGQVADVFFQPGLASGRTIRYTYKSINNSTYDCGIYARSITPGVSVVASYGSSEVHPPFSFAPVGPATSVGAEKTWSFDILFDGSAAEGTQGFVEVLSNTGCDVCPPAYRTIGMINVYVNATAPTTFFTTSGTTTNIDGARLVLDHPLTNGKPNARLFVTPNWNPGTTYGVYDTHPISVRYDTTRAHWTIQHDDLAAMPVGVAFNVRIDPSASLIEARSGQNILWSLMFIRHPNADGNPNAALFVTPVDGGVRHPHPITVRYVGNVWAVWNADGASMPNGAAFNVRVMGYSQYVSDAGTAGSSASNGVAVDVDGASRTTGNYRVFNYWWANGRPSLPVILTANYNPLNRDLGVTNVHYTGVWYTRDRKHSVFNQDRADMPPNASFNVWGPPRLVLYPLPPPPISTPAR